MYTRTIRAALALMPVAVCGACDSPVSPPPVLAIVSGSNQTADVSETLPMPLIVEVVVSRHQAVSGIPISWTVTGGGNVTPEPSMTDSEGQASVTWTLGPVPGTQTATATSSAIPGATVSFVASNGPTIAGTVTAADPDPTRFFSARVGPRVSGVGEARALPRYSSTGIGLTFRDGAIRVAAAGAPTFRSLDAARATGAAMRQRLTVLSRGLPVRDLRISPTILAAHLTVTDTTQVERVVAALRADPSVATVSRDAIRSVRLGAPPPRLAPFANVPGVLAESVPPAGATTVLPFDPYYAYQSWNLKMIDLPRTWAITSGSTAFSVALIDTGVRFEDPTIAPNFTDDGYDFVSQTTLTDLGYDSPGVFCDDGTTFTTVDGSGPPHPDPTDPDDIYLDDTGTCWEHNSLGSHGQWTSGIVGAVGNDGQTVTGIAWNVPIRPVRVIGITGDGIPFDIAQGILYAAGLPATGANDELVMAPSRSAVINLSLGGYGSDPVEAAAVAAAVQAGSLVVAAAGNGTTNFPVYPAAYPGVVGVSAVGMDGLLASYSNGGAYVRLAAPGGEFRLDNNGGDGILGPAWDFTTGEPTLVFGYGTSAASPHVAGAAALLLAHEPGLSAGEMASRLEDYASRPPNSGRNDDYGWGIVNAFNALTEQRGPPRGRYVRLLDAATGSLVSSREADADGQFAFTQLAPGNYMLQAGEDESGDGTIGVPGRRFGWAGAAANPTTFTLSAGASPIRTAGIAIGVPRESEPNDLVGEANPLSVDGYVVGEIYAPDVVDYYEVLIPSQGAYTFETSGVTGACGWGIELDTVLQLYDGAGTSLRSNDNANAFTGPNCSATTISLAAGTYHVAVTGTAADGLSDQGRYRLEVRSGG